MSGRWPVAAGVAAVVSVVLVAGCTSPPSAPPPAAAPGPVAACSSAAAVRVADSAQLTAALQAAHPGSVIALGAGTYAGNFVATAQGGSDQPIALCGSRAAVLDGGGTSTGYTLHLDGATHWLLDGFTVRGGQKGVMIDHGRFDTVQDLLIEGTGDEALHLRAGSTDDVVRSTTIRDTGLHDAKFGEGVYVGTAQSNWCRISGCGPDRSDRNTIEGNTISHTTAENVDIKEGTTAGTVRSNMFSGDGMSAATAWVNVKGNGWTIADNVGTDSPQDGFQQHQILSGWGLDNTFSGNDAAVNADGFGVNVTAAADHTSVGCDNRATGAGRGLSSIACVGPAPG